MRSIIILYLILCSLKFTEAKAQEVCHACSKSVIYENIYIAFEDYLTREEIPSSSIIYIDYLEEQDTSFFTITYELDISYMLQFGKFPECYSKVFDFLICINTGETVSIKDSLYLNMIINIANSMSAQEWTLVKWDKMTFTKKNSDDDFSHLYTPLIWKYVVYKSKILRSSWTREEMYQDNHKISLKYIPEEFFE